MKQKLFQFFLPQEVGAFENNIEKEAQKLRLKMKKYGYQIFTENICSACNQSSASGSFLQKCINFVEQRLKFPHFEGGIIP